MPAATPSRPIALITGASSGIGEALTHNFADYGHDLVLVARSKDKLKALATALEAEHCIKVLVLPAAIASVRVIEMPDASDAAALLKGPAPVPLEVAEDSVLPDDVALTL